MNASAFGAEYFDRVCAPGETVTRMQPMLSRYGVTRVARQTSLDTIGMPCFAASRPNSRTLSISQGKGLTDDAARASAIMEAIEYAVAEAPEVPVVNGSVVDLRERGYGIVDPVRYMPPGSMLDPGVAIDWYPGRGLITHRTFAVPADLVRLDGRAGAFKGICQTTNGLASGNTEAEAVFHAICELIERDAHTLWLLRSDEACAVTSIDPYAFEDAAVRQLVGQITGAGFELRMFDQTTDIGVPVIMAAIAERTGARKKFHLAAGYGAHPLAHRAAIRALTEAAQTRITSISGARDDIAPAEYADDMNGEAAALFDTVRRPGPPPTSCASGGNTPQLIRAIANRLMLVNLTEPVVVPLRASEDGFAVVRVLCSDLEDAEANLNWRPGRRAQRYLAQ